MGIPGTSDYAEVVTLVDRFDRAVEARDRAALDTLIEPIWHSKTLDAQGSRVVAHKRHALLEQLAPHRRSAITSVQMFFGDFAVLRIDAWSQPAAWIRLLFKSNGVWRFAGEAYADGTVDGRRVAFDPATEERAVLDVLGVYYRSVDEGLPAPLEEVFDPAWHMKNHENGLVVCEDRDQFLRRISAGPTVGYARDRQIADVQIVYDRLAYVRIDKPSTPGVTVFLFFKVDGRWRIVDKAWSTARK